MDLPEIRHVWLKSDSGRNRFERKLRYYCMYAVTAAMRNGDCDRFPGVEDVKKWQ